jgi:hypothetical protein
MRETVAQSEPRHPTAVAGLWVGTVAPGRLGGARGHPVAARVDGQRAFSPLHPLAVPLQESFSVLCRGRVQVSCLREKLAAAG